jgi:hypothetical protein
MFYIKYLSNTNGTWASICNQNCKLGNRKYVVSHCFLHDPSLLLHLFIPC